MLRLKASILDPQGEAITHSLNQMGYPSVLDVREGKYFIVTIEEDDPEPLKTVNEIADQLLANVVMENYTVEELKED